MHYASGAEYCVSCDRKLDYDARREFCQTCSIFNDGYDLVERRLQHIVIPADIKAIWLADAYGVVDRCRDEGEFFVPKNRGGEQVLHAMWVDATREWNLNAHGRKILSNGFRCALANFVGPDPRSNEELEANIAAVATKKAAKKAAKAAATPAPATPAPAPVAPAVTPTPAPAGRMMRLMQWLTKQVLYKGLIGRLIMLLAAVGFFAGFVSQVGDAGSLKLTILLLLTTVSLVGAVKPQ